MSPFRIGQTRHEAYLARLRKGQNPLSEEQGGPATAGAYVRLSDESIREQK